MNSFFPAALLLALPSLPAAAAPPGGASTVSVRVDDLDLARARDRAALDARLAAASRIVCRSLAAGSPLDWIGAMRCEREVLAEGRHRAAAAAAEASAASRLAQNGPRR
jgi:UrcA family protein